MLVEVKASQKAYQKATKQLFDGIERLSEVFGELGLKTSWLYVGVVFSISATETPLFDCANCSVFAIVGEELIPTNFKLMEEEVARRHQNNAIGELKSTFRNLLSLLRNYFSLHKVTRWHL